MPERIELSEEQRRHLLGQEFLANSVPVNNKTYTPEAPVAAGFKGALWRVRDEFGRPREEWVIWPKKETGRGCHIFQPLLCPSLGFLCSGDAGCPASM